MGPNYLRLYSVSGVSTASVVSGYTVLLFSSFGYLDYGYYYGVSIIILDAWSFDGFYYIS